MEDESENSHCAKPLTPIGGTPTRLGLRRLVSSSLEQDKGRKKGKGGESRGLCLLIVAVARYTSRAGAADYDAGS